MPRRVALAAVLAAVLGLPAPARAQPVLYFAGDGSALNAPKWSTNPSGPFTSSFTSGAIATFSVANGTGTGASITVSGINATENFTLTPTASTTITNQGNGVVTITVADNKTLDFGTQAFTASTTAGYIKNGNGVLALSGGTYAGGFTLNAGTAVVNGVNAFGGGTGNTLTINGGTIAASATKDLSGKFSGGIFINGDFTLGSTVAPAVTSAGLTFSNNVNLGGGTRQITLGGSATYTFSGVVSNGGLTVNDSGGGALRLTGNNTYAGGTTILSGRLQIGDGTATGSTIIGNVTNNGSLTFNKPDDSSFGGVISGTGSLTKSGGAP